jgi:uncharacterized membrane protein YcaP (DUF421 family)
MFSDLSNLRHTLLIGTLGYIGVTILLRTSGKRTLSKWNSFDFVVTIAFGSILASLMLSTQTSLVQGILAFSLLVFYQYSLTWFSARSSVVQILIKAKPSLLFYQGRFCQSILKAERVAQGEVLAAIRASGRADLSEVKAVILETDGTFSVINHLGDASALEDVEGFHRSS